MKLRFTPRATDNIAVAADYICERNPAAALRPIIDPGLAQCTVTVSPEGSTTSARKRL